MTIIIDFISNSIYWYYGFIYILNSIGNYLRTIINNNFSITDINNFDISADQTGIILQSFVKKINFFDISVSQTGFPSQKSINNFIFSDCNIFHSNRLNNSIISINQNLISQQSPYSNFDIFINQDYISSLFNISVITGANNFDLSIHQINIQQQNLIDSILFENEINNFDISIDQIEFLQQFLNDISNIIY